MLEQHWNEASGALAEGCVAMLLAVASDDSAGMSRLHPPDCFVLAIHSNESGYCCSARHPLIAGNSGIAPRRRINVRLNRADALMATMTADTATKEILQRA